MCYVEEISLWLIVLSSGFLWSSRSWWLITIVVFKWQVLPVLLFLCRLFCNKQNQGQLCVNSSWRQHAAKAPIVRSDTQRVRRLWCASTGFVDCVKRGTSVNSFTSTIWPKCQSVTSTPNLVSDWFLRYSKFLAVMVFWSRKYMKRQLEKTRKFKMK